MDTEETTHKYQGRSGRIRLVSVTDDGKIVALDRDTAGVALWDLSHGKGQRVRAITALPLALTADGNTLASWGAGGGWIKLENSITGQVLTTVDNYNIVRACAFSHDGKMMAVGGWDKPIGLGKNDDIKVWSVPSGQLLHVLKGHTGDVDAITFPVDGKTLISGSGMDGTVRLWDVEAGRERSVLRFDQVVRLDQNGRIPRMERILSLECSADGKFLAAVDQKSVRVWDLAAAVELVTIRGHNRQVGPPLRENPVSAMAITADCKTIVSGGADGTIKIWDALSSRELHTLNAHASPVGFLTFSPNGKILASASWGETVKLWDVASGTNTATLDAGPKFLLAFGADGQTLLSGADDGTVRLWDVRSGKQRATLKVQSAMCAAISPDAKTVATGSPDRTIKLWDVATGGERSTLRGHTGTILAFGPDGKTLASGSGDYKSGGEVRLWDIDTGQQLCSPLRGHTNIIHRLAFSPDGEMLASSSADGTVRLWNVVSGLEHATFKPHPGRTTLLMFHPNGKALVTGGDDNAVKMWFAQIQGDK